MCIYNIYFIKYYIYTYILCIYFLFWSGFGKYKSQGMGWYNEANENKWAYYTRLQEFTAQRVIPYFLISLFKSELKNGKIHLAGLSYKLNP